MTAIEKADDLVKQAIQVLLEERHDIERRLGQLGYDGAEIKTTTMKRRGRPPLKQPLISDQPCSSESVEP